VFAFVIVYQQLDTCMLMSQDCMASSEMQACVYIYVCVCVCVFARACVCVRARVCVCAIMYQQLHTCMLMYGVATISRLLKIIGLFCRI